MPDETPQSDTTTKKPWESKETVIGIIALLLPFLIAAIKDATGVSLSLSPDQIYEVLAIFWGIVLLALIGIRNLYTSGKISLR